MRVFITGAAGWVGSAVTAELIAHGHQVVGLARSDANAEALAAAGAAVHRGSLEDLDSLRAGAAASDGVIHCGFIHDFSKFQENCAIDRRAIVALGDGLAGSGKPLIVTSGLAFLVSGRPATEADRHPPNSPSPRVSEPTGLAQMERGVRAMVVRLPPSVHGDHDHGFVPRLIALAREKGEAAYIGDGLAPWSGVHRLDAAPVYRLALEKGEAGGHYHAVAEPSIPFKDIATAIGRGLGLPVASKSGPQAAEYFGWFGMFAGMWAAATAAQTEAELGWRPTRPGLIADLDSSRTYFAT